MVAQSWDISKMCKVLGIIPAYSNDRNKTPNKQRQRANSYHQEWNDGTVNHHCGRRGECGEWGIKSSTWKKPGGTERLGLFLHMTPCNNPRVPEESPQYINAREGGCDTKSLWKLRAHQCSEFEPLSVLHPSSLLTHSLEETPFSFFIICSYFYHYLRVPSPIHCSRAQEPGNLSRFLLGWRQSACPEMTCGLVVSWLNLSWNREEFLSDKTQHSSGSCKTGFLPAEGVISLAPGRRDGWISLDIYL